MSNPEWARLGPLFVPAGAAEDAARAGRALRVYPDGMEALSSYQLVAGASGASAMARQLGQSGVEPSSGVIDDLDHNKRLTPGIWRGDDSEPGVVDQMVREDPVAKACKLAWTLPVVRSAWTIEPNGDDARALEVAEFVRANLWEHMQGGFQQFVEHAVSMIWRGFSLSEIVVKFDRDEGRTVLDRLAPILPRTVSGWLRYPGDGWGVQQYQYQGDDDARGARAPGSGGPTNLAPSKLVHFVWDPDADAPEGTSILRPCYAGWKQRRMYLKLEAAGFERGAFGIPYVEIDPAARQGDSSAVNEILRELRTGSRAWATLPPGYTLKFADFPMKGAEIREARVAAGQDMARAALAMFLFTGEKAGAFSLIRGQQDFFQMALQSAADGIASVLSSGADCLIKRLVSWNFDGVNAFPKLTPGSISIGDPVGLVNAVKTAADARMLSADEGLEEAIRSALGLPDMPEQTLEKWRSTVAGEPQEVGVSDAGAATPAESEVVEVEREEVEEEGEEIATLADPQWLSMYGTPETARNGRPLRPEERVVRLDETVGPMVGGKEAMAQVIADWRERVAPKYAARVGKVASDDLVKIPSVPIPDQGLLVQMLQAELRRIYRSGRRSVREETERVKADPELAAAIAEGEVEVSREGIEIEEFHDIHGGCSHGDDEGLGLVSLAVAPPPPKTSKVKAPKAKAAGTSITDEVKPEEAIRSIATTTSIATANRMETAALQAGQAVSIGTAVEAEAASEAILSALGALSLGPDLLQAQRDANTIFGLGRIQEARSGDMEWGVYSTMLESDTCAACAALDQQQFRMEDVDQYATPNPDCYGGDMCNCLLIFMPKGA